MELREVNGVQIVDKKPGETNSTTAIAENFDNFLTLLTTQLKNQDPLSPMDTTEFTNQITQFAQVEQGINTNSKLDRMIELEGAAQLTTGVGYIGKVAESPGDLMILEDGRGRIGYELSRDAERVTIAVIDRFGQPVRTQSGLTGAGNHVFAWDGRSDLGDKLPDGTYSVLVSASDAEENFVSATTTTFAKVSGVESRDGEVTLIMGSLSVDMEDVRSITLPDDLEDS